MKIYFITGEPSGDLHTANLIYAFKKLSPVTEIKGMGGDRFTEASGTIPTVHIRETNVMGFLEVVKNLPRLLGIMRKIKQDLSDFQPDAVVLTDYPGFNLRMAKYAHQKGIKVFYYISPQVWAWKKGRIKTLKKVTDGMMCILPFEKDFYKKEGWEVEYVGHPLTDHIKNYLFDPYFKEYLIKNHLISFDKEIIALLPGSRKQEIKAMLPVMASVSKHFKEFQFIIAGAPSQESAFYESVLAECGVHLPVIFGKTYDLLHLSKAALVTSGTATLETALLNVPQVVCYKGGAVSYAIARRLVKIKYISLVNLILDRPAVKECIQSDMNEIMLRDELHLICYDRIARANQLKDYHDLALQLMGGASERAANLIFNWLRDKK